MTSAELLVLLSQYVAIPKPVSKPAKPVSKPERNQIMDDYMEDPMEVSIKGDMYETCF